ncbi:CsbD family protein [Fulvimonas sp. R45]|uniref:CsbD family protein n=1 Tax=Fulvimonas sp. R45 TaxID=3045937 RepID=UPI0026600F89|nr:CsbD family protein [Fulvimonas sp. R45]MDO1529582.1 CsbD family protein [Fulvimonas sp. R45]
MDKNRTEGMKHEVKGTAREVAGKVTGNVGKQVEGNVEKHAGKLQHAVGKAADQNRSAAGRHSS